MIDREPKHKERSFMNKASEGMDTFQEFSGITNKTLVSIAIFCVIVVLCFVYFMQLRKARSAGDSSAAVSVTAAEAAPAEGEAAAPAEGEAAAPAEGEAAAPAEGAAAAPAEGEAAAPAEGAEAAPAEGEAAPAAE